MNAQLITFTNLFPSALRPTHGLFVLDRMRRVAAATGLPWQVVCPVPVVPRWLRRRREDRLHAGMPEREVVEGITVWHPRYLHVPGLSLRAQARRMAAAARPLLAQLVAGKPALLDVHYVYPDGVAALTLARELHVPALVTARGTDAILLARRAVVRKQIRDVADVPYRWLAVSEDLRRHLVRATGLADEAVLLARNGVDLERFQPGDRAAARRALGLPEQERILLGVGRLVPVKGFARFAAALTALPDTRLVLVGDGGDRNKIARRAAPGRLHLLGPLPPDGVAQACRAADLLVLPSTREGWPNVVTEALASGLPVVAFAVGGVPEILTDPRYGRAIPPGDRGAFLSAVRTMLDAPPPAADVRRFAEQYGWQPTIDLLARLVREALG